MILLHQPFIFNTPYGRFSKFFGFYVLQMMATCVECVVKNNSFMSRFQMGFSICLTPKVSQFSSINSGINIYSSENNYKVFYGGWLCLWRQIYLLKSYRQGYDALKSTAKETITVKYNCADTTKLFFIYAKKWDECGRTCQRWTILWIKAKIPFFPDKCTFLVKIRCHLY